MITGRAKNVILDDYGVIKVETEYTLSNGETATGHTRYSAMTFSKERLLEDIKIHCESLMLKTYELKQNQQVVADLDVTDVAYECSSAEVVVVPKEYDRQGNVIKEAVSISVDDSEDTTSVSQKILEAKANAIR